MNIKICASTLLPLTLTIALIFPGQSSSLECERTGIIDTLEISKYTRCEPFTPDCDFPKQLTKRMEKLLNWYKEYYNQNVKSEDAVYDNIEDEIENMLTRDGIKAAANNVQNRLLALLGLRFKSSKFTLSVKNVCITLIDGITIKCFDPNRWPPLVKDIHIKATSIFSVMKKQKISEDYQALYVAECIIDFLLNMLPQAAQEKAFNNGKDSSCSTVAAYMKKELKKNLE